MPAQRSPQNSWRIRIANGCGHLVKPFEFLVKLATQFELGIPIGLLRNEDIQQAVHQAYQEAPDFYHPDKYHNRYEEQLLPMLEALHENRPTGKGRLLDLCCGHGREAEIFARAGYQVTAIDEQAEVIERAKVYAAESGFATNFIAADISSWDSGGDTWEVVYTSLWMYSTVPDRSRRLAWLQQLSQWVAPGGVLIISVTPGSEGYGPGLRHGIARLIAALTLNSRRPERGDRFYQRLFWHDFTPREIEEELQAAQMRIVDVLTIDGGTPCHFYLLRAQ